MRALAPEVGKQDIMEGAKVGRNQRSAVGGDGYWRRVIALELTPDINNLMALLRGGGDTNLLTSPRWSRWQRASKWEVTRWTVLWGRCLRSRGCRSRRPGRCLQGWLSEAAATKITWGCRVRPETAGTLARKELCQSLYTNILQQISKILVSR